MTTDQQNKFIDGFNELAQKYGVVNHKGLTSKERQQLMTNHFYFIDDKNQGWFISKPINQPICWVGKFIYKQCYKNRDSDGENDAYLINDKDNIRAKTEKSEDYQIAANQRYIEMIKKLRQSILDSSNDDYLRSDYTTIQYPDNVTRELEPWESSDPNYCGACMQSPCMCSDSW